MNAITASATHDNTGFRKDQVAFSKLLTSYRVESNLHFRQENLSSWTALHEDRIQ